MVKIAVLGYGVVGSGVAELCDNNAGLDKKAGDKVEVKYILDLRDFENDKYADKIIKDFSLIENDPEISVVAEAIGGCGAAYEFTKKCLAAGKSVVTSNKELVAEKGTELLKLAEENGVSYLFEASVGGGIPIIRPLLSCLSADRIDKIVGILNGTTNYILTKMKNEGISFADALKNAQALGYAERDPSADVEGKDSCRKICILASLAFGKRVPPETVFVKGITEISVADIDAAAAKGYAIKLLGYAERTGEEVSIFVCPCAVSLSSPIASIDDVFNGISVWGSAVGEVTFCGRGAGKLPTASAVCADIASVINGTAQEQPATWKDCGGDFVRKFNINEYKCLEGTSVPIIIE